MGLVRRCFVLLLLPMAVGLQTSAIPRGAGVGRRAQAGGGGGGGGGVLAPPIKMPAEPFERRSFCTALRDSGVTTHDAAIAKGEQHASEWREYDCSFWLSRDEKGREIGSYGYKYLTYRGLLGRMRALAMLYPDKVPPHSPP